MAHMGCKCGNDMWNGDGEIVYDVFNKKDLTKYIQGKNVNKNFNDLLDEDLSFYDDNMYFWLCNKCKKVHLWSYKPKYCYRTYELRKGLENISVNEIKKLDEYYIININEYDYLYETLIRDFIERNPIKPYKYYVTKDLTKVYIINTKLNKLEKIYDLSYESFVKYRLSTNSFDNLLIYTINKDNNAHEYDIKNGKRIQIDKDDYPHKQVNFMINEKNNNGGSISYADPNRKPEIYTANTMDKFNKKYGKYYKK